MSDREVTQQAEPVACRFCHSKKGSWTWQCYKCGEIDDVQKPAPPQQQAEPVAWDKPSASFDEWWDGDRRRDTANPFDTDSFAYWAWEGWQAALAQRQWVGLTDEEIFHAGPRIGTSDSNVNPYQILINARAIEAKLKEKNT